MFHACYICIKYCYFTLSTLKKDRFFVYTSVRVSQLLFFITRLHKWILHWKNANRTLQYSSVSLNEAFLSIIIYNYIDVIYTGNVLSRNTQTERTIRRQICHFTRCEIKAPVKMIMYLAGNHTSMMRGRLGRVLLYFTNRDNVQTSYIKLSLFNVSATAYQVENCT